MEDTQTSFPFAPESVVSSPSPARSVNPKPRRKRRKHKRASEALPARGTMSKRLPPPPLPDEILSVSLTIKHTINGQPYGPGLVTVPTSVARTLLENETRNVAEERGLSQKRAALILHGGRTIPVPPETFEGDTFASLPAAFTQGG